MQGMPVSAFHNKPMSKFLHETSKTLLNVQRNVTLSAVEGRVQCSPYGPSSTALRLTLLIFYQFIQTHDSLHH
jgi:hypothetical protein